MKIKLVKVKVVIKNRNRIILKLFLIIIHNNRAKENKINIILEIHLIINLINILIMTKFNYLLSKKKIDNSNNSNVIIILIIII
jgi:hypothetical protein